MVTAKTTAISNPTQQQQKKPQNTISSQQAMHTTGTHFLRRLK